MWLLTLETHYEGEEILGLYSTVDLAKNAADRNFKACPYPRFRKRRSKVWTDFDGELANPGPLSDQTYHIVRVDLDQDRF